MLDAGIFCTLNFAKISRQSNIGQMMTFKAYPPTFDKENLRLHRRPDLALSQRPDVNGNVLLVENFDVIIIVVR